MPGTDPTPAWHDAAYAQTPTPNATQPITPEILRRIAEQYAERMDDLVGRIESGPADWIGSDEAPAFREVADYLHYLSERVLAPRDAPPDRPAPGAVDLDAMRTRLAAACEMVRRLCLPRGDYDAREWIMSIPADAAHDPDLVIGAALGDLRTLLDRAALASARPQGEATEQRGYDRGYQKAYDGIRRPGSVFSDMDAALRSLVFAARTSGGVAGRDDGLVAACECGEAIIARVDRLTADPDSAPAPARGTGALHETLQRARDAIRAVPFDTAASIRAVDAIDAALRALAPAGEGDDA